MGAGSVRLGLLGRGRVEGADYRFGRSMWYLGRWGGGVAGKRSSRWCRAHFSPSLDIAPFDVPLLGFLPGELFIPPPMQVRLTRPHPPGLRGERPGFELPSVQHFKTSLPSPAQGSWPTLWSSMM